MLSHSAQIYKFARQIWPGERFDTHRVYKVIGIEPASAVLVQREMRNVKKCIYYDYVIQEISLKNFTTNEYIIYYTWKKIK